ncbi:MAG: hypothetical protein ACR2MD_17600 [Aridibacter sp.]
MSEDQQDQQDNRNPCYRASCPFHDWEGMAQENYSDAAADLAGHKELFPDESHTGSKVINC